MTEHNYQPGTIKSLKLVNFMCHESFEVTFGPRVNFIIGPNGSGKSALLTAIVVVLGGRATTTSRARRVNEFVMYGKKFARITCVIHNYGKIMEKERGYKPEEYGKEIIIEKTLLTEDSSKLVMKDERGKRVSERKQELDDMLDHFGILINNPICILNQEISKTFLHSKRPEDKYELFMKATNLETIQDNYQASHRMHGDWKECNDKKSLGFRMLDSEYETCKEKINFLANRAKLQDKDYSLGLELMWATFRDAEDKIEATIQKMDELKQSIENNETEIRRREEKIRHSDVNIEQHKVDLQRCTSDVETSRKKLEDLRRTENLLRSKRVELRGKIEQEKRAVERYKKDKESLQKSIDEARKKYEEANAMHLDTEGRAAEIERLESELVQDHARERTLDHSTEQLFHSLTRCKAEATTAGLKVSEITNKISSIDAVLGRLKGGQKDNLRKYGEFMVRLCAEIDRETRFKVRPRGPLGNYIKLRTPDVAGALEIHLGRNAHAFTVDNFQDMQLLNAIIKRVKYNFRDHVREPLVIARRFGRRHEVSGMKAHHNTYKTMLDHLEIQDDAVYNALVDRTSLESVLFIPHYEDAQNLMITQALIPKNTRCAYTKDCYCMYPRTATSGYKSIANRNQNLYLFSRSNQAQIDQAESEKSNFQNLLRDAKNAHKAHQDNADAQRVQHDCNREELAKLRSVCREKEGRLMKLKTTVSAQRPQLLTDFEADLDKTSQKILESTNNIEIAQEQLATLEKDLQLAKARREEVSEILTLRDKALADVNKAISDERELAGRHKDEIVKIRATIAAIERREQAERSVLDEQTEQKNALAGMLPEGRRPNNIRPTEVIRADKKDIERQLRAEIEENAEPGELIKRLEERQLEISKLIDLKNHNLANFEHTSRSLKARDEGFRVLRMTTISNVCTTFSSVIRCMGMNGVLKINLDDVYVGDRLVTKAKTLEMSIDTAPQHSQRPNNGAIMADKNNSDASFASRRASARSQPAMHLNGADGDEVPGPQAAKRPRRSGAGPVVAAAAAAATNGSAAAAVLAANEKENMNMRMTDTRSLSGGERSFSTVAFVLALWVHCSSPFKLMDEIDVFMDMVTRRMSYAAMLKFASKTENQGQFIFLSPLELPKIDDSENLVRIFEMPRIIRKGVQSQLPGPSGVAAAAAAAIDN